MNCTPKVRQKKSNFWGAFIMKLTYDDKVQIYELRKQGYSLEKLSNKEGLSEVATWDVKENENNGFLNTLKNIVLGNNDGKEVNEKKKKKAESEEVGVLATKDEDVRSLRELITYGLKGLSAYSKHANALGYDNEEIDAFMQETLSKL